MAQFLTGLFEAIFEPGPTPPLVQATNAAFAALQTVLLALLVATRSVHCVALSILCAGLWAAINWFVRELAAVKRKERAQQQQQQEGPPPTESSQRAGAARTSTGTPGGVATAREPVSGATARRKRTRPVGVAGARGEDSGTETEEPPAPAPALAAERETTVEPEPRPGLRPPAAASGDARHAADTASKRQSVGGDVSGTDSEWDKVSETEGLGDSGTL